MGIGDLAGLGDDGAVAGPVVGREARGRGGDEAGGGDGLVRGRAGGFRGIDETEGHSAFIGGASKILRTPTTYTKVGMDPRTTVQALKRAAYLADTTPRPVPQQ